MSGAELIREIEKSTDMRWKPSPGSIYPLLSWLLDAGYTKEIPDSEAGVRCYELTKAGKEFLKEDNQRREKYRSARFFGQQFDDWDEPLPQEAKELVESWGKMRKAGRVLRRKLRENYSEALVKEATTLVDDFTEKISKLANGE
jgi:DNA-binding PadR family transcriptional regulator